MIERATEVGQMVEPKDERSLGDLFTELMDETRTLFRHEVRLAKAEISQTLSQMIRGVTEMAIGGVVAYTGFLAIVAAIILLLAEIIAPWLSALVVGLLLALVGYLVLRGGQSDLKNVSVVPEQTVETLKEDREWLKDQTT